MSVFGNRMSVPFREIADTQWVLNHPSQRETIETAAILATYDTAKSIDASLKTIINLMNQLGADGIHEVLRNLRTSGRKKAKVHTLEVRRLRALLKQNGIQP